MIWRDSFEASHNLVRTLSQTFDLRLGQSLSLMARHEDGSTAGLEAVPASPRGDTGSFAVTLRDPVAGVGALVQAAAWVLLPGVTSALRVRVRVGV